MSDNSKEQKAYFLPLKEQTDMEVVYVREVATVEVIKIQFKKNKGKYF